MRERRGFVAALMTALVVLGGSGVAGAAALTARYPLQGDRASTVPGAPDLVDLGSGNHFAPERVGRVERQVLAFPRGGGLSLSVAGLVDPRDYSVAMLFRLAEVLAFRRLLDFSGGTSDDGLYDLSGRAVIYASPGAASRGAVFDDSYAHVVLTSAPAGDAQRVAVYVNGTAVATARPPRDLDLGSGVLRLFKDNVSGPAPGEESSGALACLLVYDGALTAGEVRQVADDPVFCPAPRTRAKPAEASVTDRLWAHKVRRSTVVDTGLTVSCPVGTASCKVAAQVDLAPTRRRAATAKADRLGSIRFMLPAGASANVVVRLSAHGARALREAGTLRIRASAQIAAGGGRKVTARQTGTIEVPQPPDFRDGLYRGTTSQGLPISLIVQQGAIESVFFRWRARCADGKTHVNGILVNGEPVRRGSFSFNRVLDTGARVHVAGDIVGDEASGTLSRTGGSAFGTNCAARNVRWDARLRGSDRTSRAAPPR